MDLNNFFHLHKHVYIYVYKKYIFKTVDNMFFEKFWAIFEKCPKQRKAETFALKMDKSIPEN